ncbi:hypothetical protein N0V93_006584 [Gnomoniopsis smithogilvyi]|uniref:Transmembrane protein n=1 Tax=Gnomoniopsis smithogilvyi TaxID=1191159 RepID=A0A9W9CVV2_9PEZI|nr:hypothetical protein N0V93_006584 [Gnomoniopsis smithogilvyi]
MAWLDITISSGLMVYYGLDWLFFTTVYLVITILQLVAWPVAAVWKIVLFVFAPVIYTVRFLLSPVVTVLSNFPRLEFGSAIFIGLACGLILTLTTSTTFTLLGLYDGPTATYTPSRNTSQLSIPRNQPDTDDDQKQLDALLAGISSSPESDHLIATLQGAGWRDPANTKRKRRSMNGGLRFGTILEEDDDSL